MTLGTVIRSFRSYFARPATRPLFSLSHRASDLIAPWRECANLCRGSINVVPRAPNILHTRHSAAINCIAYHLFCRARAYGKQWADVRQMSIWRGEGEMKEEREMETEQLMDQEHDASRNKEEKKPPREKPFKLISDFDKDFDFAEVFQRNRAWAETKRSIDPDFFAKLAKGQNPRDVSLVRMFPDFIWEQTETQRKRNLVMVVKAFYGIQGAMPNLEGWRCGVDFDFVLSSILWIGCSDARVPANLLIGADSGAVFVHRNIANQVLAIDVNAQSVLQYAIEFLHVPHIVVCGHYDCGGVRAALRNLNHGSPLENWLRNIRDVWRLHYDDVEKYPEGEPRARRLIELNVIEQCLNVYKTASVQKRRWETSKDGTVLPRIHGLVYDVSNGLLTELPIDFTERDVEALQNCFDLYEYDGEHTSDLGPPR